MRKFFRYNGLSIVLLALFLVFWVGQSVAGYLNDAQEQRLHGQPGQSYWEYLSSGDFWEATAENWESEFLQMGMYVLLTTFLFQRGSAESHDPDRVEEVDEDPSRHRRSPDAPWPVRCGGWIARLYSYSLSIAFFLMFLASIVIHAFQGLRAHNEKMQLQGFPPEGLWDYVGGPEFWFQSLQNWQSEFLAVFCLVVFTIFLRQKHSPQSKAVHEPYAKTGR